ncbi:DUF5667 domain-containing protein [Streptantibioticus silvisoli]|uniref:DUF5667 domain-containing protein n=1 Tax=Streptantibioticus silvisoli TaxID=2705255 RepID=A0ABT6W7D3_9ACTN|nr:DUF5667 domain-containing protein [Streptantibioticus silvisoli]MDI5966661.1 DUF5667 domain-containing protein [Streptantibioticus silvisoli]
MIGHATAHRRANAFAQALESAGTRSADARPEGALEQVEEPADRHADPGQGRLLALADTLGGLPKPVLDPEVRTVHRARLIAAMEAALADGTMEPATRVPEQRSAAGTHRVGGGLRRLRPRGGWSRRLAAGGLTVGVAAGAFSGVAAASTNALPGDTLYGLKRGMEDVRLGMAGDNADRGKLLLDMATIRMQEARRLMDRRRSGPLDADSLDEVRGALLGMHNEVAEGHQLLSAVYRQDGSLAPIEALNSFSQQQRLQWAQLRAQLPHQLRGVGNQVSSVFDAIERDVAPLKGVLPVPPAQHGRTGSPSGLPGADATHGSQSPSGTAAPESNGPTASHSSGPSAPTSSGQGLIGGSGLLDPQPVGGTPSAGAEQSGTPGTGGTAGDGKGQSGVTLPPLLPGLLPGLGLSGDDTK